MNLAQDAPNTPISVANYSFGSPRAGGGSNGLVCVASDSEDRARAKGPRVLLASRSPRRRELLREFGIEHEAAHPGFDDAVLEPGRVSPDQWVMSLAYLKARSGLDGAGPGTLVIGADTVCVLDGAILGTPRTPEEALAMLRSMRGRGHDVITGVAIIDAGSCRRASRPPERARELFVDRAHVRMGDLSDEAIEAYVASGEWRGKAGGYNLRDRIRAGWPLSFEGDETTVMGLPMRMLTERLSRPRGAPGAAA